MQQRRVKLKKPRSHKSASGHNITATDAIGLGGRVRSAAEISCACRYPETGGTRAEGAPESGGDHALDGPAGQAKTVGYRLVGDMAAVNIQACPQVGVLCDGREAMARQR